jgi:phosphoribosylglycinamide formyltransferase-1
MGKVNKLPIAVLISGPRNHLHSLSEEAEHYEIVFVGSHQPADLWLNTRGLPTLVTAADQFHYPLDAQNALADSIESSGAKLVVLAGFTETLQPEFLHRFSNRIIAIHASLLPNYPGSNSHQQAIDAGDDFHGCTVYLLNGDLGNGGFGAGPIIAQSLLPLLPGETTETLAPRVFRLERELYPWVVNAIASGGVMAKGGTMLSEEKKLEGRLRGFRIA